MPKRIQRKREKGWRLPANARCVTRPGTFGNPFDLDAFDGDEDEARRKCVSAFRRWLTSNEWREVWDGEESEKRRAAILKRLPELAGLDLACFCPDGLPCHADVLIELANPDEP